MREKILTFIEKNSRVDLADLAVMLGVEEARRSPMRSRTWKRKVLSAVIIP